MYQVDLHVHTPLSVCYADRSASSGQIARAAVAAGLDAIAVTDHHAFRGALEVAAAAANSGLTVIPGIEVTTREGHFVALFESDNDYEARMAEFLRWLGIAPDQYGDGHAMSRRDAGAVLDEIERIGSLSIAAHIDRWPSGFLESAQPRGVKERIHASEHLGALEITIPQDKTAWNQGRVRGYPKNYACIQSSDAHSLQDIGRRRTLLDVESISLGTLKLAFKQHETRVRFPGDETG